MDARTTAPTPDTTAVSPMGLVINLVSDLTYTWVDPRIDFETREV